MIISINEGYFRKMYGGKQRSIENAILICRDAGFNAIDFGLFDALPENNIMLRKDYIEVAKRLKAFASFFGNTDWEEAVKALKDIEYKGSFTLELVYGCLPEELVADYAKFNYKIAAHLVNKISGID